MEQGYVSTRATAEQAFQLRQAIRSGRFQGSTSGLASGLLQGNIVILPQRWAEDFQTFCRLNPNACPLIAMSAPGDPSLPELGFQIDIRSDVPGYCVYQQGQLTQEVTEIHHLWQDDFVTFVIGCSFSFEEAILADGIPIKNIDQQRNVSMYRTQIPTQPSHWFKGDMVVSMRPFKSHQIARVAEITAALPNAHGAPIHIGDPEAIGIQHLAQPDYGDPVDMDEDDIPVFWPCGVTPQVALMSAKLPIVITHAPGKMLVTDKPSC